MLEAGKVIYDRYQLESKLGRNVGRQTWLARDLQKHNKEQVIIKLLTFGGDVEWSDLKLFEREAKILKQLNRPNIPQYKDYFSIDDRTLWFALVQEYIPGLSLKELLDSGKRFSELEIIKIATEILETLIYLHELNPPLLHRDIKPSNLLLGSNNSIYLVDFGAVQDTASNDRSTFTVVGTYGYTPIEQFGGRTVPASDLYAVGATLIHLLTRTPPAELPSRDLKIQFRTRVAIDPQLANWLDKMTAPAIEKRFSTAKEALLALKFPLKPHNKTVGNSKVSFAESRKKSLEPFNTEIKIAHSPQALEIFIPMRGDFLFPGDLSQQSKNAIKFSLICGLFPFVMLLRILSLAASGIMIWGLFFVPLFFFFVYRSLQYLFSSSKLEINRQQFKITNFFLWLKKAELGTTKDIRDVSINYATNPEQNSELTGESIILSTKRPSFPHKFKHHLFGRGLSEPELIWLAHEIRNWLNADSKI